MLLKYIISISIFVGALGQVSAAKPKRLLHGIPDVQGPEVPFDATEMRVNHNGVYMRPLVVPVVRSDHILGYLVFAAIIKPTHWHDFPNILKNIPRVRDALFTEIFALFSRRWTVGAKLDPNELLAHVGRVVQKKFKDGMIETVKVDHVKFYKMIDPEDSTSLFNLSHSCRSDAGA